MPIRLSVESEPAIVWSISFLYKVLLNLNLNYCAFPRVALASGTGAMHLALKELGAGPGDEVIGSTLTFVGSISPVIFLGHPWCW
jgi:hypothetical protein